MRKYAYLQIHGGNIGNKKNHSLFSASGRNPPVG